MSHKFTNCEHLTCQANETPDAPRTFSSPSAGHANSTPSSAPPPYASDDGVEEDYANANTNAAANVKSAVSQAAAAVTETAQLTYEELKTKLGQAEAQLLNLKDGGLRQRNVKAASSDEKKPAGQTTQALKQRPEGVPVQIVALLCLLSFLLAYFFF